MSAWHIFLYVYLGCGVILTCSEIGFLDYYLIENTAYTDITWPTVIGFVLFMFMLGPVGIVLSIIDHNRSSIMYHKWKWPHITTDSDRMLRKLESE